MKVRCILKMQKISKSRVKNEYGYHYAIGDKIFKSIFFNYDEKLTIWFVQKLLKVFDDKLVVDNISYDNVERAVKTKEEKKKEMDMIIRIDDEHFLNLEANTVYSRAVHVKNYSYRSLLYSEFTRVKQRYSEKKHIIGIDITCGLPKCYKDVEVFLPQNESGVRVVRNIVNIVYNIDKIEKYWYDKNVEKIREYAHILMLVMDDEQLEELLTYLEGEEKKYVNMMKQRLKEMNEEIIFYNPITREEEQEYLINGIIEEATEDGIEVGMKKGRTTAEIETTKKMLADGILPETIKKYVNLSLAKINEIKTHML